MNYLELVQRTIKESGAHLDVPDDLSGLDGLQNQFKDWVSQAWQEIQIERPEWHFRQDEGSINIDPLVITDEVIVPPSELSTEFENNWKLVTLRDVYIHDPNDSDSVPDRIFYVTWNRWPEVFGRTKSRREYNSDDVTTEDTPRWFTISPKGDMHVYPRPDKEYQIEFFAPKTIQKLEINTDEPYLDEEYRLAIVFRALMEYSLYHDDRSVFERARNKYRSYKKYLEYRYLPDVGLVTDYLYKGTY